MASSGAEPLHLSPATESAIQRGKPGEVTVDCSNAIRLSNAKAML
jgi:hypothetical protein